MSHKEPPRTYTELSGPDFSVMSNFDGEIEPWAEEKLRSNPVYGRHAAWNFNGTVWYEDGKFYETVFVYQVAQETLSADNLADLMEQANERYGYE